MDGLPFLPGNTFKDPTQQKFHVSQTLGFKNGYMITKRPELGIGGQSLPHNQLTQTDLDHLANYNPLLTYGQSKQAPPQDFIPAHVAWDKKVLKFRAYFKQTVHESPHENYRVRYVDIYYYLEDDSISVYEPQVDNSGIPQGKFLKRQRLPKNDRGDNYHWKDLNLGINVTFYGKTFHVISCDKFTKDFLESEGIVVNPPEEAPGDPYIEKRRQEEALPVYHTRPAYDKLAQFMDLDRKVLRFYCLWDDRPNMFGEKRKFVLHYYLSDDTLEIRECHKPNNGRDPFPVLVGRQRVPKNRYVMPTTFPLVSMELTENEIKEYITPTDLMVGKTVNIYERNILLYDCDNFTKTFYYHHFGITDFTPVDVSDEAMRNPKMEIPPFNRYGTLEDSMQSSTSLFPQAPKKDYVKMLENQHKVLRYEAFMDSTRKEDSGRRFIIAYRLADDMLTIYEPPVPNSGILGGKFLQCTRPTKPGCSIERPDYYGPQDFYIGATIEVFSHRFIITGADAYVLDFLLKNSEHIPPSTLKSLKEYFAEKDPTKGTDESGGVKFQRSPDDLEQIVKQVQMQLKKISIVDRPRVDDMFLRYDKERKGYISLSNMKDLCRQLNLPADDDVLTALVQQTTTDPEGRIGLEDFRRFLEDFK